MLEEYLLIGLAAWRLTSFLSREPGPFDVFENIRDALGIVHNDQGQAVSWPDTFMANLLLCPWCLGVWMAGAAWLLWQAEPLLVGVLAAAAIVVIVQRWIDR